MRDQCFNRMNLMRLPLACSGMVLRLYQLGDVIQGTTDDMRETFGTDWRETAAMLCQNRTIDFITNGTWVRLELRFPDQKRRDRNKARKNHNEQTDTNR